MEVVKLVCFEGVEGVEGVEEVEGVKGALLEGSIGRGFVEEV